MKVLLYGRLAEVIGREVDVDAPDGCSIAELRHRLSADRPQAAGTLANRRARACVGGSLVGDDHLVSTGDQVEFLPPVSGG